MTAQPKPMTASDYVSQNVYDGQRPMDSTAVATHLEKARRAIETAQKAAKTTVNRTSN